MLRPMSARLLEFLPLSRSSRILDVGCGPGTLVRELRQLAEAAFIVGVDRSRGMLARTPALPRTHWCLMDGRRLAFSEASFDAAVLAFVLFHFPDMPAALRQVGRVLRPGGTIGTVTFHTTPAFDAKRVWEQSLAEVSHPEPPSVFDLSEVDRVRETNRPEKLSALLEAAGFHSTQTRTEHFEHEWDPADYLALRASFGSSGVAYRALSPATQAKLRTLVRQRFERLPSEAFRFSPTVLYATARWPT